MISTAVWTRFLPLTHSLQKIIASGEIGEVQRVSHPDGIILVQSPQFPCPVAKFLSAAPPYFQTQVDADFSINFPPDSFSVDHRLVNPDLAGGALLDLGYATSTSLIFTYVGV